MGLQDLSCSSKNLRSTVVQGKRSRPEQASTQDLPESSSCRNASRRLFSQSRRSSSVRATPRCILSLLALEWKSSASRNLTPNLLATSRPTSDLPEPDTPVRTIARAFPGDEPLAVILELILGALGLRHCREHLARKCMLLARRKTRELAP